MKKVIAVLLAVLMVFGSFSIAVFAADDEETTVAESNEPTTRNIMTDDGLVVPINFKQLKSSVIFKFIEKIVKWILGLFGDGAGNEIDSTAADAVSEIFSVIDERVSQVASTVEAAS